MKIINIVGARPNFIKIAPIIREMSRFPRLEQILLHTGQHYDRMMSDSFFENLDIPEPDIHLGVGSASHAVQTAAIMEGFDRVLDDHDADLLVVVGDVNSTIACALTAVKRGVRVAHVEAGLRSFDRGMPEEINRILTDSISDLLFTTESSAMENLRHEGVPDEKIHFVGNVMIDTLLAYRDRWAASVILDELGLVEGGYIVLTLHRPTNVDEADVFDNILDAVGEFQESLPVVFPIHPRSRKMLAELDLDRKVRDVPGLKMIEPLSYLDFMKLLNGARFAMTDSGGIQEESTVLGIPCLTLRESTERPVTVEIGTNIMVGPSKDAIIREGRRILGGETKAGQVPELWDGHAAERIVDVINSLDDRPADE
ncbi:non-hydrolyzing UDP-N-acetylglucosamine 2-epimerase [Thermodesulfobacteriota bacterium]